MNRPIEELGLDNRTYNCLKRANIHTVGELCSKTRGEIMSIRLLGRNTLAKLEMKMQQYGLEFKEAGVSELLNEKFMKDYKKSVKQIRKVGKIMKEHDEYIARKAVENFSERVVERLEEAETTVNGHKCEKDDCADCAGCADCKIENAYAEAIKIIKEEVG